MCLCICAYTCVCVHVYVCAKCACACVCAFIRVYACMPAGMLVFACICVYIQACIDIHMHTYVNTVHTSMHPSIHPSMDANKQCMCKGAYIDGMFRKTFMDHLLLDLLPPTVPATGGPSLDSEEKETLDVCVVLALQDQFSLIVDFPTVLGCHGVPHRALTP